MNRKPNRIKNSADLSLIEVANADLAMRLKNETLARGVICTNAFILGQDKLADYLQQVEKKALIDALSLTQGNKTQAAALLGMSFRSLRYKLSKFDIR